MARYIDAEKIIMGLNDFIKNDSKFDEFVKEIIQRVIIFLEKQSAADVQEVKHGKWEHDAGIWSNFEMCSLCKRWTKSSMEYDYCPNCGAKMDLKGEEE